MTLSFLAKELDAELLGADVEFSCLSTDTRTLSRGDIYLALSGENFDGNDFIDEAVRQGASGAIVSRQLEASIPLLLVSDAHRALGLIASLNRQRSKATLIALTGSQGKTTVKEMIGSILRLEEDTLITEANLNNTIGVPLTMLKITENHSRVVLEMGANSPGEIEFSTKIARPDIALITNANAAHIEGFGDLQGIVKAKGEIINGLSAEGTVVLNADDENNAYWKEQAASRKTVLFSYDNSNGDAEYFADTVRLAEGGSVSFNLNTPQGAGEVSMSLLGKHNVMNAISAAALAMESGAILSQVCEGLEKMSAVKGRLFPLKGIVDSNLIDDSYNASPDSFYAAIDVLENFSGKKMLIAGEMRELGDESEAAHQLVGNYAAQADIDAIWACGDNCKSMVEACGSKARLFVDQASLICACKEIAAKDVTFLVKGSRGARMDVVVNELKMDGEL